MGIKIVEQTSVKLTLRSRPVLLWTLGSMVLALSVVMIAKLPNRDLDTLTCKRVSPQSGYCKIERLSWRGLETALISTSELRGAEVRQRVNVDRKGNRRTTNLLVLYTDKDSFPLTYNSTQSEKERIAARVNGFLTNTQEATLVQKVEEVHIFKWIISPIVGLLGLVAILADEVTWTFNKATRKFRLIKKGIQGVRVTDYPLHQITGFKFEERQRKNKEGKVLTDYKLNILLNTGICLPFSDFTDNIESLRLLANHLKQFLNLS